jgi:hypothetical protein
MKGAIRVLSLAVVFVGVAAGAARGSGSAGTADSVALLLERPFALPSASYERDLALGASTSMVAPAALQPPYRPLFVLGVMGGYAFSAADEAVDGFRDTEFDNSGVIGASLGARFENGISIGATVRHFRFDLEEGSLDFGSLNVTPLLFYLEYQTYPPGGQGLAGHAGIGVGPVFSSFNEKGFLRDLERKFDVSIDIDTDVGFALELGGGLDVFVDENVSLSFDLRYLWGFIHADTTIRGKKSVELTDVDEFDISNVQLLVSARFWF